MAAVGFVERMSDSIAAAAAEEEEHSRPSWGHNEPAELGKRGCAVVVVAVVVVVVIGQKSRSVGWRLHGSKAVAKGLHRVEVVVVVVVVVVELMDDMQARPHIPD